ncbi:hypothetical protein [Mesorhizobium sp. M0019]|uniref:hypothetical protein n=1 Tax=Mesorhizobium sp. M0019 TaxID=2956845 RepID=UPI0033351CD0
MKTHDIAKILNTLAQALRKAPNQTLDELSEPKPARAPVDAKDVPMALSTLLALSEFDKSQWQQFITDFRLPIEVRPRDASRDILGKILTYLEKNPAARKSMSNAARHSPSDTSPELMRALQFLLK